MAIPIICTSLTILGCGNEIARTADAGGSENVEGDAASGTLSQMETDSATGVSVDTNETEADSGATCVGVPPDWTPSYRSGYIDSSGQLAGGSEILHLAPHRGRLYASAGYWMDANNIWYGGSDPQIGWGQILRLDAPDGQWEVDLDMGPSHLRPEALAEISFGTDGSGNVLADPVKMLFASAYSRNLTNVVVHGFTRDDETGRWAKTEIFSGPLPGGEDYSVRGIRVHRDGISGVDRLFLTIGVQGIFSGVYDSGVPGKVAWDPVPEHGPLKIRPLGVVEANGALLFSSGQFIYRRIDGETPKYVVVHDMGDLGDDVSSPVGGIRGLTAIANPSGPGDALIFAWTPNSRSRGHIYRLEPDGSNGFTRHEEVVLADLINDYLPGSSPKYVLAAYNNFLAMTDPSTGETKHVVGFEAVNTGGDHPKWQNFYRGAMYAVRDQHQVYAVKEVNGLSSAHERPFVATRSYAVSPFTHCGDEKSVYFGGHDANGFQSDDLAWVFSTSLRNAISQ